MYFFVKNAELKIFLPLGQILANGIIHAFPNPSDLMQLADTLAINKYITHFFSGTFFSRLTGMARDILMAFCFGSHPHVAAFWMAYRFSHLLRRVLSEGAMQSAFIPHYEHIKQQEGEKKAILFFKDLRFSILMVVLFLVIITEGFLVYLLTCTNLPTDNREVIELTAILMPSLVFISLYGLNSSFLYAYNKFFLPNIASSVLNIVWILAIVSSRFYPSYNPMVLIATGALLGFILQWLFSLKITFSIHPELHPFKPHQKRHFFPLSVRSLITPLSFGILGVAASQINGAFDLVFARITHLSGPVYLWYAIRLQQLPLAVLGVAFFSVLMTSLAEKIKKREYDEARATLTHILQKNFSLMIPCSLMTFFLGFYAIHLLFGHGEFTAIDTFNTWQALIPYGLALVPMSSVLILSSWFYAQKEYKIPAQSTLLSVGVNLILNSIFIFLFDWKTPSIAWATLLASSYQWIYLTQKIKRHTLPYREKQLSLTAYKSFFATVVSILLAIPLLLYIPKSYFSLHLFYGPHVHLNWLPLGALASLQAIILQGGVSYLCLVATAYLCRIKMLTDFLLLRDFKN